MSGVVQHQAGRLGPIREDLAPARRDFVEELRRLFGRLGMSVRQYAGVQMLSPSLVSRYLKGDVMPPPGFVNDLCSEVVTGTDPGRVHVLYQAALDSQPRGWGNATRLRREAATARRQALAAQNDLEAAAAEVARLQARIQDLEQQVGLRRDRQPAEPRVDEQPHWSAYRRICLEQYAYAAAFVTQIEQVTGEIIRLLAESPLEQSPVRAAVFVPPQSGKTSYISGVSARALDASYRLVLVLSAPLNVERTQLQTRLEAALPQLPHGAPPMLWLTTATQDYRTTTGFNHALPDRNTTVLVAKRTAAVLRRLLADLQKTPAKRAHAPALIIDAAGGMPDGATERLLTAVLNAVPVAHYVRFTDVGDGRRVFRPDVVLSLPVAAHDGKYTGPN